ncbi:MAG: SRPBCC domain-containing protein [Idiomarina sp.]
MKIKIFFTALLLLFSVKSSAEVASSSEHGFQIKLEQSFNGSAQQGYDRFVNHINGWWLNDHTWFGDAAKLSLNATAGGCFCEIDGDRQAQHMQVTYVHPNKALRLVGGLGPLQSLGMSGTMTITFADNLVSLDYIIGGYPTMDFTKLAPIVDGVLSQQLASFAQFDE